MEENKNSENVEKIIVKPEDVIDPPKGKSKINQNLKKYKFERLISEYSFLITLLLYIILSTCIKINYGPYNLNGWAFWWILFLIVPMIGEITLAIRHKQFQAIPIFFIVLVSYLLIGLLTAKWHPYWFLFLLIPLFHSFAFKLNAIFHSNEENK